jgi:hypothetical protein
MPGKPAAPRELRAFADIERFKRTARKWRANVTIFVTPRSCDTKIL